MANLSILLTLPFVAMLIIGSLDDVNCGRGGGGGGRQQNMYPDNGHFDDDDDDSMQHDWQDHGFSQQSGRNNGRRGNQNRGNAIPSFQQSNGRGQQRNNGRQGGFSSLGNQGLNGFQSPSITPNVNGRSVKQVSPVMSYNCNQKNARAICGQKCKNIPGYMMHCVPLDNVNGRLIDIRTCICMHMSLTAMQSQMDEAMDHHSMNDMSPPRNRNQRNSRN